MTGLGSGIGMRPAGQDTGATGQTPARGGPATITVWDLPVRIFHGLLILSVVGAYLSSDSEHLRLLHVTLGYSMAGLVAFRLFWGCMGTRYARFGSFVRGPSAVLNYLHSLRRAQPEHHTGHNPAGALAIVGLLALAAVTGATGWAAYNDIGGEWLKEAHAVAANSMLALAGLHVLGVAFGSWVHRENLVRSMITGRKRGEAGAGLRHPRTVVGVLLLAAVVAFWALQWQAATNPAQADVVAHAAGAGD